MDRILFRSPISIAWREQNHAFETWLRAKGAILLLPRRVSRSGSEGMRVSASYFNLLGVSAAMGRNFLPGEDQPGHDQVVILSDGLWQRRFASNPKVLGEAVRPQMETATRWSGSCRRATG